MKSILILFFLILIAIPLMAQEEISQYINQIKSELAPDKRTAIFSIEYRIDGKNLTISGEVSEIEFKIILLKKLKSNYKYQITDEVNVLPDKKLGKKVLGITKISVANIRSKPEHPAELATQAILGTPVRVLKSQGPWYLIQTPDSYLGWVDHDGIELMTEEEFSAWSKKPKIIFTDMYGLVEDLESNTVISDIVCGAILAKENETDEYYEVEFPDGRRGKIRKISAANYDSWADKLNFAPDYILQSAKKMVGFPYLWGGTSIKGIDCSGFTKTAFFQNGLVLPRDANQQAQIGEDVPFDKDLTQLIPGDLIFFGRKSDGVQSERISHVGIYLGAKLFIHSSGRVRIDSFQKEHPNYNEFRFSTIVRIKRILIPEQIEKIKISNNKFYQAK